MWPRASTGPWPPCSSWPEAPGGPGAASDGRQPRRRTEAPQLAEGLGHRFKPGRGVEGRHEQRHQFAGVRAECRPGAGRGAVAVRAGGGVRQPQAKADSHEPGAVLRIIGLLYEERSTKTARAAARATSAATSLKLAPGATLAPRTSQAASG